jgi:uncharacterized tellurite resistance protein B-like protein
MKGLFKYFNNKKVKIEHLSNLIAVAIIDGTFEEEEKVFLKDKAYEFGLSSEEVDTVLQNAEQLQSAALYDDFTVFNPKNKINKEDQLADAVYMSLINGVVTPKEYALCIHLAEKLDMGRREVDEIINLTIKLWKYDRIYVA